MSLELPYTAYKFRAERGEDVKRFFAALAKRGVPVRETALQHDVLDAGGGETVPIPDLECTFSVLACLDELVAVARFEVPNGHVLAETLALAHLYTGCRTYRDPPPGLIDSLPEPRGPGRPAR